MFYFVGHDGRYRWLNLCNPPTSIFLFLIIPLILPHSSCKLQSVSDPYFLPNYDLIVLFSNRYRIPPVVKGKNQANRGAGGRVFGVAVSPPCWPTPSHHILDGQQWATWYLMFLCGNMMFLLLEKNKNYGDFLFQFPVPSYNQSYCISFCKLGCWKCGNRNIFFLLSHLLVSFHSLKFITWKILNGNKLIFSLMNCISECEYLWLDA